jgi:Arc/MetJ-type ribon-helix-helix transcriptional regulator
MPSPVTLRLDERTRERVARIARKNNLSASEVIRQAIDAWIDRHEAGAAPYTAAADLIGCVHGGNPGRSTSTGKQFKALLKTGRKKP